ALAGIMEGIERDRGEPAAALAMARRAADLLPRDTGLIADEAMLLAQTGGVAQAETMLFGVSASTADAADLAPVAVDFFTTTRRFDEGKRWLDGEIARAPHDGRL